MPKDTTEEIAPPGAISLDPEMRKIVLAGVKFLLARLKQNKVIEQETQYKDVLLTPLLMQKYLDLVRDNLDLGKDLFVDEAGNRVFDMETPLVCGATLGELERMLVYTCASKIFVTSKKPKVVEENKKRALAYLAAKKINRMTKRLKKLMRALTNSKNLNPI